uniref:Uncharacterized protein n=1 Tax=Meloidogyne floridensis TaxID=298350 RepID=A0A915P4V5_9BILA
MIFYLLFINFILIYSKCFVISGDNIDDDDFNEFMNNLDPLDGARELTTNYNFGSNTPHQNQEEQPQHHATSLNTPIQTQNLQYFHQDRDEGGSSSIIPTERNKEVLNEGVLVTKDMIKQREIEKSKNKKLPEYTDVEKSNMEKLAIYVQLVDVDKLEMKNIDKAFSLNYREVTGSCFIM